MQQISPIIKSGASTRFVTFGSIRPWACKSPIANILCFFLNENASANWRWYSFICHRDVTRKLGLILMAVWQKSNVYTWHCTLRWQVPVDRYFILENFSAQSVSQWQQMLPNYIVLFFVSFWHHFYYSLLDTQSAAELDINLHRAGLTAVWSFRAVFARKEMWLELFRVCKYMCYILRLLDMTVRLVVAMSHW